jgi:pseudaminic acid cytidylyltransferase
MSALAIIPARSGSKRVPGKNVRLFCGRPIISYAIQAAREAGCFDEIMVSTDSLQIAEVARSEGASVPFLRSAAASSDHATTADVVGEVLDSFAKQGRDFEFACCIYATAVLSTAKQICDGFEQLNNSPEWQTVLPVLRFEYPVQRALRLNNNELEFIRPEHALSRSQDLEPVYHDAGQWYWIRCDKFRQTGKLIGDRSGAVVVSPLDAQDIDEEADWMLAELKYQLRHSVLDK